MDTARSECYGYVYSYIPKVCNESEIYSLHTFGYVHLHINVGNTLPVHQQGFLRTSEANKQRWKPTFFVM